MRVRDPSQTCPKRIAWQSEWWRTLYAATNSQDCWDCMDILDVHEFVEFIYAIKFALRQIHPD